jgi:hypothetical protein
MRRAAQARSSAPFHRHDEPEPPIGAVDTWEGFCAGNRSGRHLHPTAKADGKWRCGSCGQWKLAPKAAR